MKQQVRFAVLCFEFVILVFALKQYDIISGWLYALLVMPVSYVLGATVTSIWQKYK